LAYPSRTGNANTIGTPTFNIKPIVAFFATPQIPKNNAAARMWVKYLDRKAMAQWFKDQEASV
jgi:hypothetical protein